MAVNSGGSIFGWQDIWVAGDRVFSGGQGFRVVENILGGLTGEPMVSLAVGGGSADCKVDVVNGQADGIERVTNGSANS